MITSEARIIQAMAFVIKAHTGVKRKYIDEDYVQHPIRVAQLVEPYFRAKDIGVEPRYSLYVDGIIAALFHDIMEDCDHIDPDEILNQFGHNAFYMVKDLTHPPLSYGKRSVRKEKECEQLWTTYYGYEVQTIKCADIIDNTPSIVENDPDFAHRFLSEKMMFLTGLNAPQSLLEKINNRGYLPGLNRAEPKLWQDAVTVMLDGYQKLGMKIEQAIDRQAS